jgi:hypothetical protein
VGGLAGQTEECGDVWESDIITWAFEKDAQFSTRSLYNQLSFGGFVTRERGSCGGPKSL